jgi:hypothetical protein
MYDPIEEILDDIHSRIEGGFCDICKHHVLKKDYESHAAKNHSGTQFEKKFYEAISITELR